MPLVEGTAVAGIASLGLVLFLGDREIDKGRRAKCAE